MHETGGHPDSLPPAQTTRQASKRRSAALTRATAVSLAPGRPVSTSTRGPPNSSGVTVAASDAMCAAEPAAAGLIMSR